MKALGIAIDTRMSNEQVRKQTVLRITVVRIEYGMSVYQGAELTKCCSVGDDV